MLCFSHLLLFFGLWCIIGAMSAPFELSKEDNGLPGPFHKNAGGLSRVNGKGRPGNSLNAYPVANAMAKEVFSVHKKPDTVINDPTSPSMQAAMAVFNTKTALMQTHDSDISDTRRQEVLNEIIDELYEAYPTIFAMRHEYEKADPEENDRTTVHNHCHAIDIFERLNGHTKGQRESNRIGCCTPSDTRYLHNVAITKEGHLLYSKPIEKRRLTDTNNNSSSSSSSSGTNLFKVQPSNWHLPPIKTVEGQRRAHTFTMKIDVTTKTYPPTGVGSPVCHSNFKGTLHIIGFQTIHNVYHAMADNYVPVIGKAPLSYLLHPSIQVSW